MAMPEVCNRSAAKRKLQAEMLKDVVKDSKYLKPATQFHSVSSMHQNFTLILKFLPVIHRSCQTPQS